jgi:integrase
MKYDLIESWINNVAYSHSKSTETAYKYRATLKTFCDFIGKTPETIFNESETLPDKQFRKTYAQYIRAFIGELNKKGYASGTIITRIGAIMSFFKYNDLPLGFVPLGKLRVVFHNRDITKEEIKATLDISTPRDKAYFCIMAQSGLRPETLCELKVKHIEPDYSNGIVPCKIDVPQELTKGQYRAFFTFMGEESIKYLKAYLETRQRISKEDYLFTLHGTNKQANKKSFSKIFAEKLQTLRRKGSIEYELRKGKPSELRLYTLRKFFRKYANQAGFEFVQFWMGHIVKTGEEESYRPQDPEFHRQLYREKAMPFLRVETATPDEFEKAITERDQEIAMLKKDVAELKDTLSKLTETTQRLIEKVKE